ncbi:unnamed protein product [Meloidogyne enterolobii]|uniref:Uncharacterized protein n=1 Tax=Meloidogyne enterolobii TaxID=390850 RepID=A0ACB0YJI6_MELEN
MEFSISAISEGFLSLNILYQSYWAKYQLIVLYFPFLNNSTFLFSLEFTFSIGKVTSNTIVLWSLKTKSSIILYFSINCLFCRIRSSVWELLNMVGSLII